MKNISEAASLYQLPTTVLREVVREGEVRLSAQLQVATAADQRGLSLLGFQLSAATVILGASIAHALTPEPRSFIITVGYAASFSLLMSAYRLVLAVSPVLFSYPGNLPSGWRPHAWQQSPYGSAEDYLRQALVEQCVCLEVAISDNKDTMEGSAKEVRFSIALTTWTIILVLLVSGLYVVAQQLTII